MKKRILSIALAVIIVLCLLIPIHVNAAANAQAGIVSTNGSNLNIRASASAASSIVAKLANGISDTPVTLAAKSHLRNGRPVVIAVSSNDGLSQNAANIGLLMRSRNIFFVPFGQDDYAGKPDSLVANMEMIPETVVEALKNGQIQPKIT